MNEWETVRVCPQCRAVSFPTDFHRQAVHYVGCNNAAPAADWPPMPELDSRPCLSTAQWRALHSAWMDSLRTTPVAIRSALPERLLAPHVLGLQEAVLDGALSVLLVTPEGQPAYLSLLAETVTGHHVANVPLTEIGADAEALLFTERVRMDMALARILREGA